MAQNRTVCSHLRCVGTDSILGAFPFPLLERFRFRSHVAILEGICFIVGVVPFFRFLLFLLSLALRLHFR